MEHTNNRLTRSESLRKRPLELTRSGGGEAVPTKYRPGSSDEDDNKMEYNEAAQFVIEHQKVHDVDEHFRRSLQLFQEKSTSLPVISNPIKGLTRKSHEDSEPQQIVIAENARASSNGQTTPGQTSPQNVHFIVSSSPNVSNGPVIGTTPPPPGGSIPAPQVFLNLSSHIATGTTNKPHERPKNEAIANAQILTAGGLSQQGGTIFPGIVPALPTMTTPNFIPIIDNSGIPQFIAAPTVAAPSSSSPTSQPGTSPILYIGPGGIPLLAQPGVMFVNSTDLQRSPVTLAGATPMAVPSTTNTTPNYIVIPPTFQNFGLTMEQLATLASFQQQQQQQQQQSHLLQPQKVNVDLTSSSTDGRSSVGSSGSLEGREEVSHSSNMQSHPLADGDSVEEHFARALGDQWHQVKAGIGHTNQHNKIPA